MNCMIVSKHAMKRAHQRLSLKKKAVLRTAKIAYENGNRAEISCLNDPYVLGNVGSFTSGIVTIKYGSAYYVFSEEYHQITLVTVMIAKSYLGGTAC
jgi:hypothetical protein